MNIVHFHSFHGKASSPNLEPSQKTIWKENKETIIIMRKLMNRQDLSSNVREIKNVVEFKR